MSSNELTTLATLAIEINALDDQANYHAGQAVVYAAKCGQKLLEAKSACKHGEFGNWLSENCRLKQSQANKYMQLAKDTPELLSSNLRTNAILPSVAQAIALLSAPEEVKAEVTERIEAGENVTVKEIQELKRQAKEAEEKLQEKDKQISLLSVEKNQKAGMLDIAYKQQAELREQLKAVNSTIEQLAEAKANEAKAQAILESQNEIQRIKNESENLKNQIDSLKKQQEKTVSSEVAARLAAMQNELNQKQFDIDSRQKRIDELKQAEQELDARIGDISRHKKAIEEVSEIVNQAFFFVFNISESDCSKISNDIALQWLDVAKSCESMTNTIYAIADKINDTITVKIE